MFGIGWSEILIILVIALLVLGPAKLPEIAKGLGKGLRDFRRAMNSSLDESPEPTPPPKDASYSLEVPGTNGDAAKSDETRPDAAVTPGWPGPTTPPRPG